MQKSELTNLALDCGIASEAFPMARVINIFERADQVDDMLQVSKADRRVKTGQPAKGGDNSLEIHEFLEVVVMLAFHRANPKFGEAGYTDASAVSSPLPGCLEVLLKKSLLQSAKRNAVAGVRSVVVEEPDVQKELWSYKSALLKIFRQITASANGGSGSNKVLTMDDFLDDLFDRGIIRDQMVAPAPAVVGVQPPAIHLNLSLLDAKGAFVSAQKVDEKQHFDGSARSTIDYDEWIIGLALCGHIKYEEVPSMTLAQRVSGLMANYLQQKDEQQVLTEALTTKFERFIDYGNASPLLGQTLAAHSLFIETWKALDLSRVVGFPAWEREVFELLQPVFEQVSAIFYSYAKVVGAGATVASAGLDETLQANELASLVRDTGIATEAFPIGRINTLYVQVCDRSDQLTLPAFVTLLVLIAVHRANPKFGNTSNNSDTLAAPLPGCFQALLTKNVLKGVKMEKQAAFKEELKGLDLPKLFETSRAALKMAFEEACRVREKSRSLFGSLVMSCPTLIVELTARKLIGARVITPRASVTGTSTNDVEVALSAVDVQRAFVSCQRGDGGDEGNETIDFDEFLLCLALCGQIKFDEIGEMELEAKVGSIVATFLGEMDESAAIGDAIAPKVARFDPTETLALPGHSAAEHERWMSAWSQMDLSRLVGFPTWEKEVFDILQHFFLDLYNLFVYYSYAGDAFAGETMQQGELVDLALDCAIATKDFPMTKLVQLFDEVNKASATVNTDLDLPEFLTLLVHLAHRRGNAGGRSGADSVPVPEALDGLILHHLSRNQRLDEIRPIIDALKVDVATAAVLKVHEAALRSFFQEAVPHGDLMSERVFLQQLSSAALMRGVIVPLPSGGEARCDLTWLDASAAFHACATSEAGMLVSDYGLCLALCGMIKYRNCTPMTIVQQVAGFYANLAKRMDEHDVLKTSLQAPRSPRGAPPPQPTGGAPQPPPSVPVSLPMKASGASSSGGGPRPASPRADVAKPKRPASPRGGKPTAEAKPARSGSSPAAVRKGTTAGAPSAAPAPLPEAKGLPPKPPEQVLPDVGAPARRPSTGAKGAPPRAKPLAKGVEEAIVSPRSVALKPRVAPPKPAPPKPAPPSSGRRSPATR